MRNIYFDIIMVIERLHRLILDAIKLELERLQVRDLTTIQCFILYNVGSVKMTIGEISNRGYYLGSNVTYNLKKMIESGYIIQTQSSHDRRSSHICLSEKGLKLYTQIDRVFQEQTKNLRHNGLSEQNLKTGKEIFQKLETFLSFRTYTTPAK